MKNVRIFIAANGQGLLQGWNSLLVRPEPLLNKDIKVQVNKQKPNNVRPAQMKYNSDMTIAPMSFRFAFKFIIKCTTIITFSFFASFFLLQFTFLCE
jgi:hypothetical protein